MKTFFKDIGRLHIFYGLFGGLCLILISGLYYRQVIQYEHFIKQEKQQSLRRILKPGTRGDILDRNGILLVGNRPVFSAVIYLNELRSEFKKEYRYQLNLAKKTQQPIDKSILRQKSRQRVIERYLFKINQLLNRTESLNIKLLEQHFSQRLLLPFTLIYDLNTEEYAKLIEILPINGPIQLHTDNTRYYPYGSLAAHTLGYIGHTYDIPELTNTSDYTHLKTFALKGKIGRNGLEKTFDHILQGQTGAEIWLVDPAGFQTELIEKINPTQGHSLQTSLDFYTQQAADEALQGLTGTIIALEPQTGEILALSSHPTYDLNRLVPFISTQTYDEINEKGAWLNRAIQGLYPPGSPFKIITAIGGLSQNKIPTYHTTDCNGYYKVGNRLFPCMKRSGHGTLHLEEAIAYSCNPFFYETALTIGPEHLTQTACLFGLNQATGIELPYESKRSLIPNPEWKKQKQYTSWLGGDTANTAIGQGFLLVTPIQMACFTASLARKECTTTPTLLYHPDQKKQKTAPLPITNEDYQRIIKGMELSTKIGTGKRIQIPNVRIAAKSGTAQLTVRANKQDEKDLAWCIAFAPIEDPKIAVCVLIEEVDTQDRFQGGTTACPLAKKVIEARLNALKNQNVVPSVLNPVIHPIHH